MPTARKPPTVGRTLAGLAVMVATVAIPAVVVAVAPGPLWARWTLATCCFLVTFIVGSMIVQAILGIVGDASAILPAPHDAPHPGPGDVVHEIAYEDREKGCTDPRPHEPHYWYWTSVMPLKTLAPTGEWVTGSAPVEGRQWCRGVR